MVENSRNRTYSSPLRNRQKENTRERILEAVAEIISEGRILDFNIKEVADRAGVSYAAVYQHFPTKEALLEGLYEEASKIMAENSPFSPSSLGQISTSMDKTLKMFEDKANIVEAFTISLLANKVQPKNRQERDLKIQQLVANSAPNLTLKEAKQAAAVIAHLYSSLTWLTLKQRFGLNSEETANSLRWALETLIKNLESQSESS
ncbi:MAG: TetR/AcrR family transcriptional regulator [Bacillota bacterium]